MPPGDVGEDVGSGDVEILFEQRVAQREADGFTHPGDREKAAWATASAGSEVVGKWPASKPAKSSGATCVLRSWT